MSDATFTFRVDDLLKREFNEAAKQHDQTGAQLMRAFMRDYVKRSAQQLEHDAWFRRQVQLGLDSAEADDLIPNDDVESTFAARRAAVRSKLGDDVS